MGEEIDLGRYVEPFVRRWWLVIGPALLCAIIAGVATGQKPRTYQARVLIATAKEATQVSFDTAITSLSEEQLGRADRKQRLGSFVQLISSPTVAQAVLDDIGDQLPERNRHVPALLHMVTGGLARNSDSIEIIVTHTDPVVARIVADAWGRAYVHQVNLVYASTGGESLAAIQQEIRVAQGVMDREQTALEAFLRQDRTDELDRRIAEYRAVIQSLSSARKEALAKPLNEMQRIERLLAYARDMYAQLELGGEPAARSNGAALVLLKVRIFAGGYAETPLVYQIQADSIPTNAEEMKVDLNALIAILETRQASLNRELVALSEFLSQGQDSAFWSGLQFSRDAQARTSDTEAGWAETLHQLEDQVRSLQAESSEERALLTQMTTRRDLARETYDTLVRKEAELAIAVQTTGAAVRVAMPAAIPAPERSNVLQNVGLAAVVGLMLGGLAAWAIEAWRLSRARTGQVPSDASAE